MSKPTSSGRSNSSVEKSSQNISTPVSQSHTQTLEINYLKKDLLKVLALTILALGIQFLLFFSQRNGLLVLGW